MKHKMKHLLLFLSILSLTLASSLQHLTAATVPTTHTSLPNTTNASADVAITAEITPELLQQFNPLILNIMKQIVESMELPLPDQVYNVPQLGQVKTHFEHVRCHDFQIQKTLKPFPGLSLGNGFIGFALGFDVVCRAQYSTNFKFIPSGWVHLTLYGTKADTALSFDYDAKERKLIPVIQKLDLSFRSVDVSYFFSCNHHFNLSRFKLTTILLLTLLQKHLK
jgi:hypothetical protein